MKPPESLLSRWANGDETAGRAFFKEHADGLARFFSRRSEADAADLLQRSLLKCLEACKQGREIRNERAFLFAIARNELYDHLKQMYRGAGRFSPEVTSLADMGTSPTGRLSRSADHHLLLSALSRVSLDDQLALELYYWESLSMEEVAQVLGVTRSAALNRVHRARRKVGQVMEELGAGASLVQSTLATFEGWARDARRGADER